MSQKSEKIAIISGAIIDVVDFKIIIQKTIQLRVIGLLDKIIISTWYGEINNHNDLRAYLENYNISICESRDPGEGQSNIDRQKKAFLNALHSCNDNSFILGFRSDKISDLFQKITLILKTKLSETKDFGKFKPFTKYMILCLSYGITMFGFITDTIFYGYANDLKSIVKNSNFFTLFSTRSAEIELMTVGMIQNYPKLRMEDCFSTFIHKALPNVIDKIVNSNTKSEIPSYIAKYLALSAVIGYNLFQFMDEDKNPHENFSFYDFLGINSDKNPIKRNVLVQKPNGFSFSRVKDQYILDKVINNKINDKTAFYKKFLDEVENIKNGKDFNLEVTKKDINEIESFIITNNLPIKISSLYMNDTKFSDNTNFRENPSTENYIDQVFNLKDIKEDLNTEEYKYITENLNSALEIDNNKSLDKIYKDIADWYLKNKSNYNNSTIKRFYWIIRSINFGNQKSTLSLPYLEIDKNIKEITDKELERILLKIKLEENNATRESIKKFVDYVKDSYSVINPVNTLIKPVVSVIGSCRVHSPLTSARKHRLITTNNTRLESYSHAIKEVTQKLNFATGKIKFPKHLDLFINGTEIDGNKPEQPIIDMRSTDLFVIEISTIKQLEIDGFFIQQNYFIKHFIEPNKLENWWRDLTKLATEKGSASLVPTEDWISEDVKNLASSAVLSINTEQEIIDEMKKIYNQINLPIIFVGHFTIPNTKGVPIEVRVILSEALKKGAQKINCDFWEPAELILSKDGENSLRPKSTNHWYGPFVPTVGKYLVEKKILPLLTARRKKRNLLLRLIGQIGHLIKKT